MSKRERRFYPTHYPTDLTDTQWSLIEPIVTAAAPKGGRPTEIDLRAIVNALLYKNRTGCQWRMIPSDFPPMGAIRYYFDKWTCDGTFVKLNDIVRKAARNALERDEEPSISVIDSQSTKTTEVGGDRGIDGGKKDKRAEAAILG
jgi:putative transposase